MKKCVTAAMMVFGLSLVAPVQAKNPSLTLGYAQSKVQDYKNIRGVNVKYRYEWDSPVSFIGSFTYMSGSENARHGVGTSSLNNTSTYQTLDINTKLKYYSLSAGPA